MNKSITAHPTSQKTNGKKSEVSKNINSDEYTLCKSIFNEAIDCIYILDINGNILDANKSGCRLLGYSLRDLKLCNFLTLPERDQQIEIRQIFKHFVKSPRGKSIRLNLRKKNNGLLFVEAKFVRIKRNDEDVIICIGQDISGYIKSEYALRESEQKSHLIFDNMMSGFALMKVLFNAKQKVIDFTFLQINKSFETITSLKKNKIINKKLSGIVPRSNVLYWIKIYNETKKRGEAYRFEKYFPDYNRWLNLSASIPERDKFVISFEDINERKKAEEAYRYEQSLLQSLLDHFPDTMYFKDNQSRFIRINTAQAKTLGIKNPSDAIGKADLHFFSEDFSKNTYKDEQRIINSGIPLIDKLENVKLADGTCRWVSTTKVPMFNSKGKVNGLVGISRDITERINAEKELIETRQQLKNIFDNLDHVFWSKDIKNNKYVHVSHGSERIFGYSPECFYKDADLLQKIIHKDDWQEAASVFSGNVKEPAPVQLRIINSNRQIRWIESSIKHTYDIDGNVILIDGMIVDITERKKAEEQILISEHKFRSLYDGANDAIFLMDGVKLIDCNLKTYEMFECTRNQIINKTAYEISPVYQADGSNSKTAAKKKIEAVLSGIPQFFEWEHQKFNGITFSSEISLNKVVIEGKPLIQAIVRDITEKKKAQKIQNALYRISEAVNTTENISTLYKKIHETIKELMKANNFYIALYDEVKQILTFPYFVDEIDPIPEPRVLKKGLTEYVLRTGMDILIDEKTDYELRAKGDIEVIGEPSKIWMGVALKIADKPIGVIAVQDYQDAKTYTINDMRILNYVSEQIALAINKKSAEEKLINYARELKELNASKDKFFSIISHDLRSPFHALLGLTEIMIDEFSTLTMEELKSFNQEIYKNLRNLYRLIDNLLEWSRIQTGKMEFRPVKVNLFQKSGDIFNILMGNALKKGIKLENCIPEEIYLFADQDMLQSILQNLVSNAIKFTNTGGTVKVSSELKNDFVEICVSDSGIGIKPDELDLIFRIDTHYSTLGTSKEKGTGLGLVLCKDLIEKHGGKIWVESEYSRGTDFIFTLPIWQDTD